MYLRSPNKSECLAVCISSAIHLPCHVMPSLFMLMHLSQSILALTLVFVLRRPRFDEAQVLHSDLKCFLSPSEEMAVEKAFGKLIKRGICNACSFSSSPSPFCLSLAWNPSSWLGGNWILAVWPRKAVCRSLVLLSHFALVMCGALGLEARAHGIDCPYRRWAVVILDGLL